MTGTQLSAQAATGAAPAGALPVVADTRDRAGYLASWLRTAPAGCGVLWTFT
jgi:hypothetical protein